MWSVSVGDISGSTRDSNPVRLTLVIYMPSKCNMAFQICRPVYLGKCRWTSIGWAP